MRSTKFAANLITCSNMRFSAHLPLKTYAKKLRNRVLATSGTKTNAAQVRTYFITTKTASERRSYNADLAPSGCHEMSAPQFVQRPRPKTRSAHTLSEHADCAHTQWTAIYACFVRCAHSFFVRTRNKLLCSHARATEDAGRTRH